MRRVLLALVVCPLLLSAGCAVEVAGSGEPAGPGMMLRDKSDTPPNVAEPGDDRPDLTAVADADTGGMQRYDNDVTIEVIDAMPYSPESASATAVPIRVDVRLTNPTAEAIGLDLKARMSCGLGFAVPVPARGGADLPAVPGRVSPGRSVLLAVGFDVPPELLVGRCVVGLAFSSDYSEASFLVRIS